MLECPPNHWNEQRVVNGRAFDTPLESNAALVFFGCSRTPMLFVKLAELRNVLRGPAASVVLQRCTKMMCAWVKQEPAEIPE